MKKILLIVVLILSVVVTGCSDGKGKIEDKPGTETSKTDTGKNEGQKQESEENKADELPIHPDDVKADIKILDPDSIGSVYLEATFTNNTEYPIVGYNATVLNKDTNEKSYLSTYDTVMPGEKSPTFEAFGPKTQKEEDYEILKLEIVAKLDNGNELHVDYDFKLETAEWYEYKD